MATSAIRIYSEAGLENVFPNQSHPEIDVNLAVSTVFARGTVLGKVTAGGRYKAYASGNSDGSQNPEIILQYNCATDAAGNVTFADVAGGGTLGETFENAPAYAGGSFYLSELTGLDANAITKLAGHTVGGVFIF